MKTRLLFLCLMMPLAGFGQLYVGDYDFGTNLVAAIDSAMNYETKTVLVKGDVESNLLTGIKAIPSGKKAILKGYKDASLYFKSDGTFRINVSAGAEIEINNLYVTADSSLAGQGGLLDVSGTAVLVNSHFYKIRGSSHGGLITTANSTVKIYNCIFEECATKEIGGVLFNKAAGPSDIVIKNSKFLRNKSSVNFLGAKGGALGLLHKSSNAYIENCLFDGNTCSTFDNSNVPTGFAGAIYTERTPLVIINSTFVNNLAGDAGGAIHGRMADPRDLMLINCTLIGNKNLNGSDRGAAIHLDSPGVAFKVYNSIIQGNISKETSEEGVTSDVPSDLALGQAASVLIENSFLPAVVNNEEAPVTVGGTFSASAATLIAPEVNEDGVFVLAASSSTAYNYGNPAFLSPYTNTDQRGWVRKMTEPIDAGAYELDAFPPDSIQLLKYMDDQVVTTGETFTREYSYSFEGVFQILDTEPNGDMTYAASSSNEGVATALVDGTSVVVTTVANSAGKAMITITATYVGYDNTKTLSTEFMLNVSVAVGIKEKSMMKLNLYPNPVSDKLQLSSRSMLAGSIVNIYNIAGSNVLTIRLEDPLNNELDVRGLKAGIYFLKVENGNENFVYKFIKR